MSIHFTTDSAIFLLGLMLLVGVLMARFSNPLGLPALVFFIVLTSALIQGGTLSPLARRRLGLSGPPKPHVPHVLELVSMGKTKSELYVMVLKA